MTKADHPETIKAAREFKKLFDETIMADVKHGVNLTPFEEEIFNTGGRMSRMLGRIIGAFED